MTGSRNDANFDHVYANQAFTHKLNEFGIIHQAEEYNGTSGDQTGASMDDSIPKFCHSSPDISSLTQASRTVASERGLRARAEALLEKSIRTEMSALRTFSAESAPFRASHRQTGNYHLVRRAKTANKVHPFRTPCVRQALHSNIPV